MRLILEYGPKKTPTIGIIGTMISWSSIELGLRIFIGVITAVLISVQFTNLCMRRFVCRKYEEGNCDMCPYHMKSLCPGRKQSVDKY